MFSYFQSILACYSPLLRMTLEYIFSILIMCDVNIMPFEDTQTSHIQLQLTTRIMWAGYLSRYSDWLRAGRSDHQIPVGARISAHVQTGPGAHPASSRMGTGSFPVVKIGRGVTLTPHPLLVLWSGKGRAIPLLPLWAVRPVQGCTLPLPFTRIITVWPAHQIFKYK